MMISLIAALAVNLQLFMTRFGLINFVACMLLTSGLFGRLWLLPHLKADERHRTHLLNRTQKSLQTADVVASVPPSIAQRTLAQFYDTLGDAHYAEQQVKAMFAIAGKNGLTLTEADYQSAFNKPGKYSSYQIVLPVEGSYAAIRAFCEQTLLTIPFISLNEMRFKRDAIGNKTLGAHLRFTLYLSEPTGSQQHADVKPAAAS